MVRGSRTPYTIFPVNANVYPINQLSGISLILRVTGGNWKLDSGIKRPSLAWSRRQSVNLVKH